MVFGGFSIKLKLHSPCRYKMDKWKRSERAVLHRNTADASESDNKEADHNTVSCVGLFGIDGGKDHYSCKNTCMIA